MSEIKVIKRKTIGRKVKGLRKQGILPANIYGKNIKSNSIQVVTSDFEKLYKEAGETGLVELITESGKKPVLIHNVQKDPVTDMPIHVDFLQVNLKEKVTAEVPIELIGVSPAEKQGLGTVVQYINEVEVEALPKELPEKFEIDISSLSEVDQIFYVKQLPIDIKKVNIKTDPEQILLKVEPPKEEKEEAPVVEEAPAEEATPTEVSEGELAEKEQKTSNEETAE